MQPILSFSNNIPGDLTRPLRANLLGWLIPAGLIAAWFLVIAGVPGYLNVQLAAWLTFIGLLITPGYFLADLITWRLELDWLERLALAFPLGLAVLAVPGITALLFHLTIVALAAGWLLTSALILIGWLLHRVWRQWRSELSAAEPFPPWQTRWAVDEIIMLLLLLAAFILIVPTLSRYKIDGDAYAVGSFSADALAGRPLNGTEPLFGTTLGPGVRMVFNQSLPMFYLWAYLASAGPITLTAAASRAVIALWAILASYTLGKAAYPADGRRFGLFTAAIQLLIYLAAPFIRGDNVSLFFFERINADKFMVPVTMLPVIFALALRYIRHGRRGDWLAAAVATLAVSAIHPLMAAMLALALTAFGSFHVLLELHGRIIWPDWPLFKLRNQPRLALSLGSPAAWRRTLALGALVLIVMFLPLVQLVMARGEAPLAPSYPRSFDGWSIGEKRVPVLPFVHLRTLAPYGPLPDLSQLEAGQANTPTNPFLVWRFAVNMDRQRLILFDLNHYISDPTIILEPPYLLALLLLPALLWRIRSNLAAQFAVSVTLAVLFVMFNPIVTPLIGSLVMPWILWRLVWLLPYALIIALPLYLLLTKGVTLLKRRFNFDRAYRRFGLYAPLAFIVLVALAASPAIAANIKDLNDREASPYFFPTPKRIFSHLNEATAPGGPAMVLADQDLSVTIPAYVANAAIVAHRAPTTSEIFPGDRQDEALQRLIDQDAFFRTPFLTTHSVDILRRYDVRYVITASGSDLDMQLRLTPQWFEWLVDDQSYSLYAVRQMPAATNSIQGNTALVQRRWEDAGRFYEAALAQDPTDLLALVGLADIAHAQGQFEVALSRLQHAADQIELPGLHYRLGQLYAEQGQVERSIAEFDRARQAAPGVARFYVALGDACLRAARENCAAAQYQAAVANESLPDAASRLMAQGDLWRQRGRVDQALPLYEQAVVLRPNEYNQFTLASAYREAGQFDRASSLARTLWTEHPFSAEVLSVTAELLAAQKKFDGAINLYRQALLLQNLQVEDTTNTHLGLAGVLLAANRPEEASHEILQALTLQPYNASGYRLLGDLYRRQRQFEAAIEAYRRTFELDPTQVAVYVSLNDQLRQHDGQPAQIVELLQTASHLNPDESTLALALGDQLQRQGDLPAAIESYQSALTVLDPDALAPGLRSRSTGPSRAFAYARLARLYEDLGRLEPAMNYYHAAVAAAPDLAWSQVMLGDALRRRNDLAAAEAAYRLAVKDNPGYVNAYLRLADLLSAQGNTGEANALYERVLQIAIVPAVRPAQPIENPGPGNVASPAVQAGIASESDPSGSPLAYYLAQQFTPAADTSRLLPETDDYANNILIMASLHQRLGQADQALERYRQGLLQGAEDGWPPTILAQFHKGLGDLYLAQGQLAWAVETYQQAVILDGWWPEARLSLADALSQQGDMAGALHHVRTAAEIAPGSVEAQVALAGLLDRQGDSEPALQIYQAMAQAHPGHAQATLALARAWQDRGHPNEAEQSYLNTIALNPSATDAYLGLAELKINQAQYDEAERLLQQALKTDHQNVNIYVHLFELEQRRGQPERALAWVREAAALPLAEQTTYLGLIDALLRYGNYDTARTYAQEALKRWPDDIELSLRSATILRTLGRYVEAETALAVARGRDPADSRPNTELAELYLAQGRPQEALLVYQQALELRPQETAYYLALSQIWTGQGRFDQARAVLEAGQAQAAQPADLFVAQANLELRQGQPDRALETLEQGLSLTGQTPPLLLALGDYYASRAEFDQAEQQYQKARELQPNGATITLALANLSLRRGQTETALEQYRQAITLDPVNPGLYLALGNAYHLAKQPAEAETAYTTALALAPTMVEARTRLAAIYQDQERWDEAQALYEQGLTMLPASGELLTGFAAFWLKQDDQTQALALLDRVTQLAPTAATLTARAKLYQEMGRADEATGDLQIALQKEPGSLDALLALGDIYRSKADYENARLEYEKAVTLMPGVPTGYLRLADLANDQGDSTAAENYVEAARAAEPGSLIAPGDGL